jgi:hypothetical protein
MVCVCPISKWVEAIPVPDRASLTMAKAFHEHVVCRYGVPGFVRVDRGLEYRGDFAAYLRSIGTVICMVSTAHPRANGVVERYNRVIKQGFRKLMTEFPGTSWRDHLPDILAGIRMLPTTTGLSPYLICFK